MLNNGFNDFLFGVHCVEEGDRVPSLHGYGQTLKQFIYLLIYYYYYKLLLLALWLMQ